MTSPVCPREYCRAIHCWFLRSLIQRKRPDKKADQADTARYLRHRSTVIPHDREQSTWRHRSLTARIVKPARTACGRHRLIKRSARDAGMHTERSSMRVDAPSRAPTPRAEASRAAPFSLRHSLDCAAVNRRVVFTAMPGALAPESPEWYAPPSPGRIAALSG